MKLLLGVLVITLSGCIGYYYDYYTNIKSPTFYWSLGAWGALLAMIVFNWK